MNYEKIYLNKFRYYYITIKSNTRKNKNVHKFTISNLIRVIMFYNL